MTTTTTSAKQFLSELTITLKNNPMFEDKTLKLNKKRFQVKPEDDIHNPWTFGGHNVVGKRTSARALAINLLKFGFPYKSILYIVKLIHPHITYETLINLELFDPEKDFNKNGCAYEDALKDDSDRYHIITTKNSINALDEFQQGQRNADVYLIAKVLSYCMSYCQSLNQELDTDKYELIHLLFPHYTRLEVRIMIDRLTELLEENGWNDLTSNNHELSDEGDIQAEESEDEDFEEQNEIIYNVHVERQTRNK